MQRRDEAEDQAGEDGDAEGKGDDGAVHLHRLEPRNAVGLQAREKRHTPDREQQPDAGAAQREDDAFGQELPEQPTPARAQGRAHRHFRLSSGSPRQQQVGDIRARDQKDEPNRAEQHQHRLADIADHRFLQRKRRHADVAVGVWILLFESAADRLDFSGGLLWGDARLQARDHAQVPRRALLRHEVFVVRDRLPRLLTSRIGKAGRHDTDDFGLSPSS